MDEVPIGGEEFDLELLGSGGKCPVKAFEGGPHLTAQRLVLVLHALLLWRQGAKKFGHRHIGRGAG